MSRARPSETGSREPSPGGLGPSGFDPARRDFPQRWEEVPFSAGSRYTANGWRVERTHDERDNFYTVYDAEGRDVREFRNDLTKAILYAEFAIATEARRAGTVEQGPVHEGAGIAQPSEDE